MKITYQAPDGTRIEVEGDNSSVTLDLLIRTLRVLRPWTCWGGSLE